LATLYSVLHKKHTPLLTTPDTAIKFSCQHIWLTLANKPVHTTLSTSRKTVITSANYTVIMV